MEEQWKLLRPLLRWIQKSCMTLSTLIPWKYGLKAYEAHAGCVVSTVCRAFLGLRASRSVPMVAPIRPPLHFAANNALALNVLGAKGVYLEGQGDSASRFAF